MNNHPLWTDDYWPLIMQLYMSKPTGVKTPFSKPVVDLAIELHIPPKFLHEQMHLLRRHATPSLQRIWDTYTGNPRRLGRDVKRLRQMAGFGSAGMFYEGVLPADDFAADYSPIAPGSPLTRVMLIIILDLYYRLTPITMVKQTPEVAAAARLLGLKPEEVVSVLCTYQTFDPILHRPTPSDGTLTEACRKVWKQYGSEEPERLAAAALRLAEYYKKN